MSKINILAKEVTDKIAAGEVVERPASVIKELAENSLDAGSTHIEVFVEDAGRALITVIDDGEGMISDDLQKACLRHATSKISRSQDLFSIRTLGFRGEALASIAAVSFLFISSRHEAESSGNRLEIEGGVFKRMKETARTQGTTIEVRNLFFNTPARLKFLKSKATEMFHIIKIITELALVNPQAAFKLVHNKEELIDVHAGEAVLGRIALLLGQEAAAPLVPVSFESAPLKISGFVSKAGSGYSHRKNQHFFVNKRPVSDKTLSHALGQGYHAFLNEHHFPGAVIFIDILPDLVDVNVHPNKREVRFREASLLHDTLVNVIRSVLTDKEHLPQGIGRGKEKPCLPQMPASLGRQYSYQPHNSEPYSSEPAMRDLFPAAAGIEDNLFSLQHPPEAAAADTGRYLQAGNTYIVLPDAQGVLIIDQHAAHERVLFDELREQFQQKRIEKQRLLLPLTLQLNKAHYALVREYKPFFNELGFEMDEFGADTFAVHSYPAVLAKADIKAELEGVIAEIADSEISPDKEARLTQFLATIACHCAVRAHERLNSRQIESLLCRLRRTSAAMTCPHGRPTMIILGWDELGKRFKRK
ncbi:MAG: DNA mismatch repair endonuclease MutL [Candidatus Omnitrophica bacterium]|nr:DNA mismatch repair endonuclease MutL [Candidatus Omnitrophota bacterium]MBU4479567.1 DNA mismatch repair endonuclease MutL [Candidatus Omnitrophota bacterium]MCG2704428.1 DNA mismatch repair endonuclease MutL [Candidatus Omnitrophota bacterium]